MTTPHIIDLGAADTPPKPPPKDTADTTDTGTSTAPPRTPEIRKLEGQLRDFYGQMGTYAAMMMPDPFAGSIVAGNAEMLASAWADLAAQDVQVKRTLQKILSGGSWAAVIIGHAAGVVLPILAYYGRLPDSAMQPILGLVAMQAMQPVEEGGNPVVAQCIARKYGGASNGDSVIQ